MIAQEILYTVFRKCGQLRPGAGSNPELYADGLAEWGRLFDSWAAERTMGFSIPQFQYAVTGPGYLQNGNGYTIGPAFSFDGTTASGSPNVTVANTQGLIADQPISGAGIPASTTILSVSTNASIVMSKNATADGLTSITVTPNFLGPRPDSIVRANLVMTNVGPQPVYIPIRMISVEEWSSLAIRQIPAINVTNLAYYDPQFPQGVFNVFPPLNGNSIELFTWAALATPAGLSSSYSAPPGYLDAIIYSLAERMWPMMSLNIATNKVPLSYLSGMAYEARQKVRAVNRPIPTLRNDQQGGSRTPSGYFDSFVKYTGEPY